MRKTYLITLLLCCFSALLNGAVSPFSFSSLKMEEGLSQLSVLKIHQDKSGFMWFATRNGLNRYDGNSFVVYKHSNGDSLSLSSNHVMGWSQSRQLVYPADCFAKKDPEAYARIRYRAGASGLLRYGTP